MNLSNLSRGLLAALTALALAMPARAADETSPLDLTPRDAAAFVHVRVADLWNHNSLKPYRDLLGQDKLKEMQRDVGFLPGDIETVTVVVPEFGGRDLIGAPLIIVRTLQPYDKLKLLTTLKALTPAQANDWRNGPGDGDFRGVSPSSGSPQKSYPKVNSSAPPRVEKDPFQLDPKELKFDDPKIELKPPPKLEPNSLEEDNGDEEKTDEPEFQPSEPFRPWLKPDVSARHYLLRHERTHLFIVDERTVMYGFAGGPRDGNAMLAYCVKMLKRAERGPLDGALAEAAKKHTLVIGINVAELAQSLPGDLPPELAKLKPLLAARAITATLDFKDEIALGVTVTAENAASTRQVEDAVHGLLGLGKELLPKLTKEAKQADAPELALYLVGMFDKALAKVEIKVSGSQVTATTAARLDAGFADACKAAVGQLKFANERVISQSNLRQIGIALHNYHDANGRLPFPGIGRNGAPLGQGNMHPNLSWRVAILPYIEQENLYRQFKLDEAWDSEHNKTLIEKMPKVFAPVNGVKADNGHTFYQIFTGREAFQAGAGLQTVTDGLSQTLMVVEAGDAVPWTRPEDMLYDSKKPLPKLGGLFDGDFNASLGDGSVRFIRKSIPEKVLRALITVNGGEAVDWDWGK